MHKYLLDTNICIYTIKNRPSQVRDAFIRHQDQLCVSTVTAMELIYGAEKSTVPEKNLGVIESFLARLAVIQLKAQHAILKAQEEAVEEVMEIYSGYVK